MLNETTFSRVMVAADVKTPFVAEIVTATPELVPVVTSPRLPAALLTVASPVLEELHVTRNGRRLRGSVVVEPGSCELLASSRRQRKLGSAHRDGNQIRLRNGEGTALNRHSSGRHAQRPCLAPDGTATTSCVAVAAHTVAEAPLKRDAVARRRCAETLSVDRDRLSRGPFLRRDAQNS